MTRAMPVLAAAALLTGCGGATEEGDGRGAGVSGLGGNVKVETLARASLEQRPRGEIVWITDEVRLRAGESIDHRHGLAFAYARRGSQLLRHAGEKRSIDPGAGAAVASGESHTHSAGREPATIWETRLASSGARPAPGFEHSRRVFESGPLRGIPTPARVSFLSVTVPPRGGRTTVHTHPGPELIYQLSGRIDYQNALIGTKRLGPGGLEAIPPGTAVQKRNPFSRPAVFLSWFLVDPSRPFAPEAEFE